tara:strand:+ start:857 stop:1861 length:1005 start_codon:yes stop_codon:yes gene_type:complete
MKKVRNFKKEMISLTKFHYSRSIEYRKILDFLYTKKINKLEDVPFLPINLFKDLNLKSISESEVFKILHSSGTSGNVSKIFLDKFNAQSQSKALNKIMSEFLGKERLPMLIVDKKIKYNKNEFNAKIAAIIGFSIFGKKHHYLLNEKNEINYEGLNDFLKKFSHKKFLVFGFTSQVFENLIEKIEKTKLISNFQNGYLLHGGGWKKMESKMVDNKIFKLKLSEKLNFQKIINYYGLIEQTGSIFLECEKCGNFKTSEYSDILVRGNNFEILKEGKKGFIQLLSLLPTSYPGHSILTEDIGSLVKNNCKLCFGKKSFLVHGRVEKSETRGCSDAQ